jgi:putative oxidoreductase
MVRYSAADTSLGTLDLAGVTRMILRVGVGLLFLQHGLQKVFGMLGGRAVPLDSMMGVAGLLELTGGVLMTLGLFTRPVAAVLLIEMLAAYVMAHHPRGGFPAQNGGEIPLLFALVFVDFAGNGAGRLSVDAALGRSGRAAGARDRDALRAT